MRKRRRGWEETRRPRREKRRWWWRERMRDLPKTCLKGCCSFSFRRSRKTREAEEFNFSSHRIYYNYLWGLCSDGRSFSTKKWASIMCESLRQEMRKNDEEDVTTTSFVKKQQGTFSVPKILLLLYLVSSDVKILSNEGERKISSKCQDVYIFKEKKVQHHPASYKLFLIKVANFGRGLEILFHSKNSF